MHFQLHNFRLSTIYLCSYFAIIGCKQNEDRANHETSLPNYRESLSEDLQIIACDHNLRILLEGDIDQLYASLQSSQEGSWIEQARYVIRRLPDQGETLITKTKSAFQDERLFSEVKHGTKNYSSVTFFHQKSGLLIHRMLCDHPGSLHTSARDYNASSRSPSLLVVPFESTLDLVDNQQVVKGEGECAVVISIEQEIQTHWAKICHLYDPDGGKFPDVISVIEQLDQEAAASLK
jgi:hypothetical protein